MQSILAAQQYPIHSGNNSINTHRAIGELNFILNSEGVKKYGLTADQAAKLTWDGCNALNSLSVQKYIDKGWLKIADAIKLSSEDVFILEFPEVQTFLDNQLLSMSAFINATGKASLLFDGVRKYIGNGLLKMCEAIELTLDGRSALNMRGVQIYIDNGSLKMKEAVTLNERGRYNLEYAGVQKYIGRRWLTVAAAVNLPYAAVCAMETKGVQSCIDLDLISREQVIGITPHGSNVLNREAVQAEILRDGQTIDERRQKVTQAIENQA
jgi:hypothetical protein